MRGRYFGFVSAVAAMLSSTITTAFTAFVALMATMFAPNLTRQRNTQTPNLGMQRQQVGMFQRRLGVRGKRHQRMARAVFGSAAMAA